MNHSHHISIPSRGEAISLNADGSLAVPDNPILCYIEGDGVGVDIMPNMKAVVDEAVLRSYGGKKQIHWLALFQGEQAARLYDGEWVPEETLDALRQYHVAIKGPVTTPLGGGFRSLNIALRQEMDLYVNLRPVKAIEGLPSPMKDTAKLDVYLFRDCSEDIYSGIEWPADSPDGERLIDFMTQELGVTRLRHRQGCGLSVKNISREGSRRLVRQAIQFALKHGRKSVTLVHQGNALKSTEGAFRQWGLELAREEFSAVPGENGTGLRIAREGGDDLIVNDCLTDHAIQQLLLYPERFDVIATTNQSGDLLADMVTAQTGGLGIMPAANLNEELAIFEPTHGTYIRAAGQNKANPSSIFLSAVLMLRHINWHDAANRLERAVLRAISQHSQAFSLDNRHALGELGTSGFTAEVMRSLGD